MIWPPEYTLKKHPRARHVKLKASAHHGLEIVVPLRFNPKHIPEILENNKAWIEKKLEELRVASQIEEVPFLPENISFIAFNSIWQIHYVKTHNKNISLISRPNQELVLLGNIDNIKSCKKLLIQWIKEKAKQLLSTHLQVVSQQLNLPYGKATIRAQSTRWGSCSSTQTISLNYKLLFLPTELMTHVLIHELCHTVHMNHSGKFWRLVASFDSNWKEHNRQVRQADQYVPRWLTIK